MQNLEKIILGKWVTENGKTVDNISLFYQVFGHDIGKAPVVLVNHALTGNSNVTGKKGWWNDIVGEKKIIDTRCFTIIAFNIPGNGFDGDANNLIANYKDFTIRDIAEIFWQGLDVLKIDEVFAIIGGSLGGAIGWEMTVLQSAKVRNLIPIATDWKATDWILANVLVQDQILNNSDDPIADARLHAMLLYRTPESINQRFQRQKQGGTSVYQIENWLVNHGVKLKNRFRLAAYKLMNHLLKTNDITRGRACFETILRNSTTTFYIVAVDSDYFFTADESWKTYQQLQQIGQEVFYNEIRSIHGHDAFLIESEQLSQILNPIFNTYKEQKYVSYQN
ncbi:MAG TPA: alpha/beta fold hydrolase [Flavobacterium sp.]|jgi:homoserine O-acetyltransferase